MEKQKKKQKGITLVALVISIIVMLILAGVSLNMTIGDNGIIKQAQSATLQSSLAMLQDYLDQEYVRNYDEYIETENKISNFENVHPEMFYIPANEGIGSLRYVIDSDGNALYLIKKSGLPADIRENLLGGDAGNGTYTDYQALNDVYGVTANLKAYYCSNGKDGVIGIESDGFDKDNPNRVIFSNAESSAGLYNLVKDFDTDGDGKISAEEIKSVKTLTIDSTSSISSLSELYNLTSLKELVIDSKNFPNLNGIQNCGQLYYLYLKNCQVEDYSALAGNANKLQYLYFYNIDDNELKNICAGIKNADFTKLQYLGFVGNPIENLNSLGSNFNLTGDRTATKELKDISPLATLKDTTKKAIKYLYLQSNKIQDISALSGFTELKILRLERNNSISSITSLSGMSKLEHLFLSVNNISDISALSSISKLTVIRLDNNSGLKTLNGLQNCTKLNYVFAPSCSLGTNETTTKSSTDSLYYVKDLPLTYLDVRSNTNLKHIAYGYSRLGNWYLSGCSNLVTNEISEVKERYNAIDPGNKNIDEKYKRYLNSSSRIDYYQYADTSLTNTSDEIVYLYNNKDVKYLRLDGNTALTDNVTGTTLSLNQILSTCTNMVVLSLRNLNISSIEFVKNMPNLKELDLYGCNNLTDLTPLENTSIVLSALRLDNSNVVLSNIPRTLSSLEANGNEHTFLPRQGGGYEGGLCASKEVYEKVGTCTGLTNITWCNHIDTGAYMDLSGTQLIKCDLIYPGLQVKLPATCEWAHFQWKALKYKPDFTLCAGKLKYLRLDEVTAGLSGDSWDNWFSEIKKLTALEELRIDARDYKDLSKFGTLSTCTNLKKLYIRANSDGIISGLNLFFSLEEVELYNMNLQNLNSLSNNTNLYFLIAQNCKLTNIDGIKDLTALKHLQLYNNNISALKPLEKLTNLGKVYKVDEETGDQFYGTVNLGNNTIYDTSSYTDSNGNTVVYNNLEILANLNYNKSGNLRYLYLSGNTGIVDYSPISKLSWSDKSGF